MEQARRMLDKNPAKFVAEKFGYKELHSFYRAFRRATGHGMLAEKKREGR